MTSRYWICLCFLGCVRLSLSEPIVKLDVGRVRGIEMESDNGKMFYAFRGIPYAEPPSDKRRFNPPVTKLSWGDKVFDATEDGPLCPQMDFRTNAFVGQEDNCLIVNVYTPQISDFTNDKLRPVMVYIHGGAFSFGTGASDMYGPQKLMDNDIIFVTFNYRIGPLGFLSTADSKIPGNYGMLDQVEALKWVNKHIRKFGGDVQRITIFGSSAGGVSVTYHMLSPLSKGLFQHAIALSGSALSTWGCQSDPLFWTQKIGMKVGCPVHDKEKMVKCLKDAPVEILTKGGYMFKEVFLPLMLAPTIDGYFLTDTPKNLIEKGLVNKGVTFTTGVTKDEAAVLYAWHLSQHGPQPFTDKKKLKRSFKAAIGGFSHNYKAVDLMYNKYVKNLNAEDVEATQKIYTKVNSEGLFEIPHYQMAHLMAKAGVKTYAFNYDYQAPFSFTQLFKQKTIGVAHMDDAFMLFYGHFFNHGVFDDKSKKMKKIYQSLLTNIAFYGNPTPEITDDIPVKWTPVQSNKLWIYHVNDPISIDVYDIKNEDSFKFWTVKIPKALEESRMKAKQKAKDEL